MQNMPTRADPSSSIAALPWNATLRPLEEFHQNQYSLSPKTRDVECVTTTTVAVRNIMNEYLAHLSNKPPKPDLPVGGYVEQLDGMGDQGKIYRYPSNVPPTHIPFVGDISRAGWMYPRTQMLRALDRFASELRQEFGCSYTVEQRSRNSYVDITREVRNGKLVIIHLMHDPNPQAPGQFWIGGNPHTLGPVIKMDPKEITLLDTGASRTTTYSQEDFMKFWSRSSQFRVPPAPWMPKWLPTQLPFYYAYTPPRTMTVITPDTPGSG